MEKVFEVKKYINGKTYNVINCSSVEDAKKCVEIMAGVNKTEQVEFTIVEKSIVKPIALQLALSANIPMELIQFIERKKGYSVYSINGVHKYKIYTREEIKALIFENLQLYWSEYFNIKTLCNILFQNSDCELVQSVKYLYEIVDKDIESHKKLWAILKTIIEQKQSLDDFVNILVDDCYWLAEVGLIDMSFDKKVFLKELK